MKRKICFPITSRAYYGRSQLLIRKLHAHPGVDLKLMLGGSILLDKYSRHVADDIAAGGFDIEASLFNVIEGGNHVAMAKTACLTALEFTNTFFTTSPDVVVPLPRLEHHYLPDKRQILAAVRKTLEFA